MLQAGHDLAVRQKTRKQSDSAFSFELAPLSGSEANDLKDIALTIFHTAAFIIGGPKAVLAFLLRGQPPVPEVAEFWTGRPHVHIVRFRGQCNTASANEAHHGADFGRILCRAAGLDDAEARSFLPKDARMFEDFGAYVSSAASLWVWSKNGLSEQKAFMDANRGNLIYERQVLAELLEYGYMLHRRLYQRVETFATTAEVIAARKEILRLRRVMREASHSGEIRSLLDNGWSAMGLPELISDIKSGLELRALETTSMENLRTVRVGWALTTVFGFVAVPALAEQLVKPIWKLTPFHLFGDALTTVVSDAIAVVLVLIVVGVTLRLLPP